MGMYVTYIYLPSFPQSLHSQCMTSVFRTSKMPVSRLQGDLQPHVRKLSAAYRSAGSCGPSALADPSAPVPISATGPAIRPRSTAILDEYSKVFPKAQINHREKGVMQSRMILMSGRGSKFYFVLAHVDGCSHYTPSHWQTIESKGKSTSFPYGRSYQLY